MLAHLKVELLSTYLCYHASSFFSVWKQDGGTICCILTPSSQTGAFAVPKTKSLKACTFTQSHRPESSQGPDRQIALTVQLQMFLSLAALPDLKHNHFYFAIYVSVWLEPSSVVLVSTASCREPLRSQGTPSRHKSLWQPPRALLRQATALVCGCCVRTHEGVRKGGDHSRLVTGSRDHLPSQSP